MMHFSDSEQWEAWLAEHHQAAADVWLKIAKKGAGAASVTAGQALDAALCYGWIDSHRKTWDAQFYLQRYSPRRKSSPWSRINVERAEALAASGRMRPPGLAAIAAAQADGRWAAAYTAQRNATTPPDLAQALAADPQAAARFAALDKTGRYRLILPLLKARTPAGRAARLDKAISSLQSR